MQTLRDYQVTGEQQIRERIRAGYRRVLYVLPTGGGKTTVAASIIHQARGKGSKIVFLAHRKELIDQASTRLDGLGVHHGIIMADHPRSNNAPVQVASIQTLHRRGLPWEPDLVFVDECFPAGTMVSGRPIESLAIGDTVNSYNHASQKIENRPVLNVFKSKPSNLVTVVTRCGKSIVCTANHPFFTGVEYVTAVQLKKGDKLLTNVAENMLYLRDSIHSEVVEQHNDSVLQNGVQVDSTGRSAQGCRDAVQGVRQDAGCEGHATRPDQNKWDSMLAGVRKGVASCVMEQIRGVAAGLQQTARVGTHDEKQSDEKTGSAGEGQFHVAQDWMETQGSLRERQLDETPVDAFGTTWLEDGSASGYSWREVEVPESGYRERGAQDSRGSGRVEPLCAESQGGGRGENSSTGITWVESVEVHEQTSDGRFGGMCADGFVYNIEVEGNNNYFADGVLVHNCHRIRGNSYQQVIADCGRAVVIGITATPCRTDGKGLAPPFETIVQGPSLADLTTQGYLVPSRTYARKKPNLAGVHTTAGDYQQDELQEAMNRPEIVGDVVKEWQKHAAGRTTAVFAVGIKHSIALCEAFRAAGVAAEHLAGETSTGDRERLLRDLASGKITVLTNCGVLTEGWDCPPVSCVSIVRPTQSLALYLQMAGRALRTAPGKTDCVILDHGGCVYRHGLITAERQWSLDGEESRALGKRTKDVDDMVKVCPDCDRVAELADESCPCGYVFKTRRKTTKQVDGELELVTDAKPITEDEKRRKYEWFLTQQHTQRTKSGAPYSPAYAVIKFRAMYGHQPKRGWREAWVAKNAGCQCRRNEPPCTYCEQMDASRIVTREDRWARTLRGATHA